LASLRQDAEGAFTIQRKSMAKKMRGTPREIKASPARRLHPASLGAE
jgi:hypothetical protein